MADAVDGADAAVAAEPTTLVCNGPTATPILHLHLLQRCNLSCLHCYSASGPRATAALSREEAVGAVDLAAALGFDHIALSGGEPLLSPHLEEVLTHARARGLRTSIVTNGIQSAKAASLERLSLADSVCVSLDGVGATHNHMRQRPGSFEAALRTMSALSAAGVRYGVSCGVSRQSLEEMEQVTAVAAEVGASFLNFHAVEPAGRGRLLMADQLLSRSDHAVLYVAAHLLAQATRELEIHCDLVHKDRIADRPALLYLESQRRRRDASSVAQRLGVLVVEPDGVLSPVCFGFDPRLALGTLQEAIRTAGDSVASAMGAVVPRLQVAGAALVRELDQDDDWLVFNPSAELSRVAQQHGHSGATRPLRWSPRTVTSAAPVG